MRRGRRTLARKTNGGRRGRATSAYLDLWGTGIWSPKRWRLSLELQTGGGGWGGGGEGEGEGEGARLPGPLERRWREPKSKEAVAGSAGKRGRVGFGRRREHEVCRMETRRGCEERSTRKHLHTAARERIGTNDPRSNSQENFADVDACESIFPFCFNNKEIFLMSLCSSPVDRYVLNYISFDFFVTLTDLFYSKSLQKNKKNLKPYLKYIIC
jgi:hypothetical protein